MIKKRLSPNSLFEIYEAKSTQPLDAQMKSKLFWLKEVRKMSDQGAVKWTVGDRLYKFQAVTNDIFWKHKNTWLNVRIDPDNPDCVHLFDKANDDFIGVIKPRLVLNKENKKEVLQEYSRTVNGLLKYEKEMRKMDKNMSDGLDPEDGIEYVDIDAQILRKSIANKNEEE